MPLIDFKISEGNGICEDGTENLTPNTEESVLSNVQRKECSKLDTRYIKLMSLSEQDFFTINQRGRLNINLSHDWIIFFIWQALYLMGNGM